MTPEELRARADDLAQRVRALEASMAEVKGDQATLRSELASLRELLVVQLRELDKDITNVDRKFDKRWDQLEAQRADDRKDSRSLRNILIGVGVAAVLSPIGGILVAVLVERSSS